MWRIINLSALLVVGGLTGLQTADINDILGNWIQAAFYPVSAYAPVCIRYTFTKGPEDLLCTCGGSNVSSIRMFMETDRDIIPGGNAGPIIFVDTVDEVMPALGLSCKCGDKEEKHAVARVLNKDYFILYHEFAESMASTRTEVDPNVAYLFGRKVVPESVLAEVMTNNDELKKRRGAMMCATENFNGFISDKFKELGNQ